MPGSALCRLPLQLASSRTRRKTFDLRAARVRQSQRQGRGWRILSYGNQRGWIVPVVWDTVR